MFSTDTALPLDGIDLLPILTGVAPVVPSTLYWRYESAAENFALEGNMFASSSSLGCASFMAPRGNFSGQYWKLLPHPSGFFQLTTLQLEAENRSLEGNQVAAGSTLGGGAFMAPRDSPIPSGQLWKLVSVDGGYYRLQGGETAQASLITLTGIDTLVEVVDLSGATSSSWGLRWKTPPTGFVAGQFPEFFSGTAATPAGFEVGYVPIVIRQTQSG